MWANVGQATWDFSSTGEILCRRPHRPAVAVICWIACCIEPQAWPRGCHAETDDPGRIGEKNGLVPVFVIGVKIFLIFTIYIFGR